MCKPKADAGGRKLQGLVDGQIAESACCRRFSKETDGIFTILDSPLLKKVKGSSGR